MQWIRRGYKPSPGSGFRAHSVPVNYATPLYRAAYHSGENRAITKLDARAEPMILEQRDEKSSIPCV